MEEIFDKKELLQFIEKGLEEDLAGQGDHSGNASIPENQTSKAEFLVKDEGILCGLAFANAVFNYLDEDIVFSALVEDGTEVHYGDIVARVEGNTREILKGERLILNTMQRLSGVSTLSRKFAEAVKETDVKILDTRKTTPGMRFLEKWAVRTGGSYNYRTGLYDWIMLKDNHINGAGGITNAVAGVKKYLKENNLDLDMTVEVTNLDELREVLSLEGVRRVMLDNFSTELLGEAVQIVNGKIETEASGGITLETVREKALTGVDFISVGALTHSAPILDISLNFI